MNMMNKEKYLPSTLTNEGNLSVKGKSLKDVAKCLCDKSGCHHKCKNTTDCVVEDEAKLMVSDKEKQIEEMAKVLCEDCARDVAPCRLNELGRMCDAVQEQAKALYNAGYRKQSEVAREIIKDLVKFADDKERHFHGHGVWYIDADDVTDFITELKKKYTESEDNI